MRVALEWERLAKIGRDGKLVEAHVKRVCSEILEKTTGFGISDITARQFLSDWLKKQEFSNKAATAERYGHAVNSFLENIGIKADASMSQLSHKDFAAFIEMRRKKKLAPKTISVDVKILNTAFNLARKLDYITANPVEKALALSPIAVSSKQREPFTEAQVKMLFDAAQGEWKTMILLANFTGARIGDCARMRWEDVDFVKGVLQFIPEKTSRKKRLVVVPLHPDLEKHLQDLASNDTAQTYLCPKLAKRSVSGKTGLSEEFKKLMKRAGVDSQTIQGSGSKKFSLLSFHSFRHKFVSALANNNTPKEIRMQIVGHSSEEIHGDYTHLDVATFKTEIAKLPSLD